VGDQSSMRNMLFVSIMKLLSIQEQGNPWKPSSNR